MGRRSALAPRPPPPRAPPRPASPDSLARASAPQDGKTALDLAKSNNKPECVWLLENLKLLLDEPDLLRLPFANIEPAYRRRTCIRLAVVRFWRDAAMRNQYNINATTIGGRPGGDGLRRDQAEDCEADASLPSAFAADERASKMARTS